MDTDSKDGAAFSSVLFNELSDLQRAIKSMDEQMLSASEAATLIGSQSTEESAATALDRARNLLYKAAGGEDEGKIFEATEKCHEMLNDVEEALLKLSRFIEDDARGLMNTLEKARLACPVSSEAIEELLVDWKSLARKHGISPYQLPACHQSLKIEKNGNDEIRSKLPDALRVEEEARRDFDESCILLSREREDIAESLSRAVSLQMPDLGMDGSIFSVSITPGSRTVEAASVESGGMGTDTIEFFLYHTNTNRTDGGQVQEIASSGEKCRLLLAIESSLPGSVGSSCRVMSSNSIEMNDVWTGISPVAIVYDEIDAHVGGRAAVAISKMLAQQSLKTQILAITHTPSVAAAADAHLVVQPRSRDDRQRIVNAQRLNDSERRKELARMASGDLAVEEAEAFADALIRDGMEWKKLNALL